MTMAHIKPSNMGRNSVQPMGNGQGITRFPELRLAGVLVLCALFTGLVMVRVNAVKSQVQMAERQILALKIEQKSLETEFETRANQQQLADLNVVDFGYAAPEVGQYVDGERQLAAYSKARTADSPPMIRMARLDENGMRAFPEMVSPMSGKRNDATQGDVQVSGTKKTAESADFVDRLSQIRQNTGQNTGNGQTKNTHNQIAGEF